MFYEAGVLVSFLLVIGVLLGVAILYAWLLSVKARNERDLLRQRGEWLRQRWGEQAADAIMSRKIWAGMTEEMLLISLGHPSTRERHVMATRYREVWKYDPHNRHGHYGMRVTLDDGVVVAWTDLGY